MRLAEAGRGVSILACPAHARTAHGEVRTRETAASRCTRSRLAGIVRVRTSPPCPATETRRGRQDQLWPFVLAAVLNKKGPFIGAFAVSGLIRRSVMDDMRVALKEALSVRVRLPLLKAHVGDADNHADDRDECYHFSVFSLFISAFRRIRPYRNRR
jgi:hypothetical protein